MKKKIELANVLLWILTIFPLAITLVALPLLPDTIPAHYGIDGIVNRWGSKYETLIIGVVLPLILLSSRLFDRLLPKDEKLEANRKVLNWTFVGAGILFAVMTCAFLYMDFGSVKELPADTFLQPICVAMGIAFAIIGNFMPKTKRNGLLGVRVKWTLASDEVWFQTHRFAGKLWICGGIAIALLSLLLKGMLSLILAMGVLLVLTIASIVYAYVCYTRVQGKH